MPPSMLSSRPIRAPRPAHGPAIRTPQLALAMTEIGAAARRGRQRRRRRFRPWILTPRRRRRWRREPFLVRGVQAQLAGDAALAADAHSRRPSGATRARCRRTISSPTIIFARATPDRGLSEFAASPALRRTGRRASRPISPLMPGTRRTGRKCGRCSAPTRICRMPRSDRACRAMPPMRRRSSHWPTRRIANARSPWLRRCCSIALVGAGHYAKARAIWARCRRHADIAPGASVRCGFRQRRSAAAVQLGADLLDRRPGRTAARRSAACHLLRPGGRRRSRANCWSSPPGRYRLSMRLSGGATHGGAELDADVPRRAGAASARSRSTRGARGLDLRRTGQLPRPMARTVGSRPPTCRSRSDVTIEPASLDGGRQHG